MLSYDAQVHFFCSAGRFLDGISISHQTHNAFKRTARNSKHTQKKKSNIYTINKRVFFVQSLCDKGDYLHLLQMSEERLGFFIHLKTVKTLQPFG